MKKETRKITEHNCHFCNLGVGKTTSKHYRFPVPQRKKLWWHKKNNYIGKKYQNNIEKQVTTGKKFVTFMAELVFLKFKELCSQKKTTN